jgi:hypothetical protein
VDRFTQLTQAARAAKNSGGAGLAEAGELLGEAAGLWLGEPLAGVPGPYAESQRTRLTELRLSAAEDRLAIGIELGGHACMSESCRWTMPSWPHRDRRRRSPRSIPARSVPCPRNSRRRASGSTPSG